MTHQRILLSATLLLALGACSHGHSAKLRTVSAAPRGSAAEIDAIALVLNQGDKDAARKRLKPLLKADPMDASARLLSDSIERDPKELLGPQSFAYTTKPGDSMIELAQRFLGNRLKAYQLARYNGIANPSTLAVGQVLRIPGAAPRAAPVRVEPRVEPTPRAAAPARPRPAKPAPARPSIAKPAPVANTNPAGSRQARAAGLAALAQGNIARAVGLLSRATALDPANVAAARDLQRAERIAATVRARR